MAEIETGKKTGKKKVISKAIEDDPADAQGSKLAASFLRFKRSGWDILGIVLLAFSIMLLAGILGISRGFLLTPLAKELALGLGWGKFLAIALLFILSYIILSRGLQRNQFKLGQLLALEGWVFVVIALLAEIGGHSLERAENGLDGGVVGWGLAEILNRILPFQVHIILLLILFIYFPIYGLGLYKPILALIDDWFKHSDEPIKHAGQNDKSRETDLQTGKDIIPNINLGKKRATVVDGGLEGNKQNSQKRHNLPPYDLLLNEPPAVMDEASIHTTAQMIEQTLAEFGIPSRVVGYRVGPTVTQFAVEPGYVEKIDGDGLPVKHKIKVSQISVLGRDLALALSAQRLRIEAPVPGKSFVGIEVPNDKNAVVRLRPLIESSEMQAEKSPLTMALGKDVSGKPLLADLIKMPHLLIAGTTGSGKTVSIATITMSLIMNNSPEDLRLAMLDPKKVELWRFNSLPHIIGKVETDPLRMLAVLRWALVEMDRRYKLLEQVHARDLETYNQKMLRRDRDTLPRIVIIIDELADLMMTVADQTEHALVRLAQMARATGLHLIVATQRPSTDVVTGLIKANFPARISFSVASSIDSRVILDTNGAETLLGRGDMLFINPEIGSPIRAQGAMVTDIEMDRVINFWRESVPLDGSPAPWEEHISDGIENEDALTKQAIEVVKMEQRASASMLQRRLRIGYPRAARLIDELEQMGIVGPSQTGGKEREVLISPDEDDKKKDVDDV